MQLGAFSLSLAVKDIHVSLEFYQKLGFNILDGKIEENWLILQNGDTIIGLFQEMFEENILTFVPGWDQDGKELDERTDIRDLQQDLKEQGVEFVQEADSSTT